MSPSGFNDPRWGLTPGKPRRPHKVHLRTGVGTTFTGPACGSDLKIAARGRQASAAYLTDDPTKVTCQLCRKSYPYQLRLEEK